MKNILIITFLFCFSTSNLLAQEKIRMELKDGVKPDVYIDGKKYDYAIFDLLDQTKIESMFVLKDAKAIEKYNAPNGVIIIKTKKAEKQAITIDKTKIKIRDADDKEPMIIIDGKVAEKGTLSKLSPDDIKSIEVVKGDKAKDKYNAPNGVIIVTKKK